MTDFMDVVRGRRALRRYEEKDIPEELLNRVLEAVQWSPSWANTQVWEEIIVTNFDTEEPINQGGRECSGGIGRVRQARSIRVSRMDPTPFIAAGS